MALHAMCGPLTSNAASTPSLEDIDEPLGKRRRTDEACALRVVTLFDLMKVRPGGPPDFGGQVLDYLWSVRHVYSAPVEYLLMRFGGACKERDMMLGVRKIVSKEFLALLRCSRSIRVGAIAAVGVGERVADPEARGRLQEIGAEARERYPRSWAQATACCA
mmetsp:Transcript_88493/g.247506  ORF Transcript_88493/g.247506 Transcript_88493/m.247506 type:complete len:162 (+) Transcript_88493:114-599(+)